VFRVTRDLLSYKFVNKMNEYDWRVKIHFGIQVKQYDNEIFISQSKYAQDMVKKFGMKGKSYARMPMSISIKISSEPTSKCVDSTLYKSMIGSLLYITTIRPDIAFSIGMYTRFQSNPKESHLTAVKRILKYLSFTSDYGIWYS